MIKKCGLYVLSFAVSSIALLGVLSSSVSAVSPYDNAVKLTDNLIISDTDYSYDWYTQALEALSIRCDQFGEISRYCEAYNRLDTLMGDNADPNLMYAVQKSDENQIQILFSTDENAYAYFDNWTTQTWLMVNASPLNRIAFEHDPTNPWSTEKGAVVLGEPNLTLVEDYLSMGHLDYPEIFLSTYPIDYPPDYEGEIIPDSINLPVEPFDLKAHWKVTNRQIQIKDITNYDTLPNECWFQLPNNQFGDNFTEYYYDCENPTWIFHQMPDEYQTYLVTQFALYENGLITSQHSVLIDGSSYDSEIDPVELFEDCINEDFPFIHPKECVSNLMTIFNKLSFNTISFGNNWDPNTECRQLGLIGEWLMVSADGTPPTVCPQVPAEIRNVVTPFITFALGLFTVGFLTRRTGLG